MESGTDEDLISSFGSEGKNLDTQDPNWETETRILGFENEEKKDYFIIISILAEASKAGLLAGVVGGVEAFVNEYQILLAKRLMNFRKRDIEKEVDTN